MYCWCANLYCHRVTTQMQLINISYHIITYQSWNHIPCIHPGWSKLTILHHMLHEVSCSAKLKMPNICIQLLLHTSIYILILCRSVQAFASNTKRKDNRILDPIFKTYHLLFCKFPHFLCTQVTKMCTINQLNSMQQSSPWEVANSSSNNQEIHHVVWSLQVYSKVHKGQPLFPTPRKINQPTPSHPINLTSILISSSHPCPSLPCGLFPSSSPFVYFCSSPWIPEVSKTLSCLNCELLLHN